MNIGIRFSSPIPDEIDIKLLSSLFGKDTKSILEILDNAPLLIIFWGRKFFF